MKKITTFTFVLSLLACGGVAAGQVATSASQVHLGIGDQAPAFSVSTWVKGNPVTQCQKGTLYVVDFWATWCPPCNAGMPHLSKIATKYQGKVQVVGVDVREKSDPGASLDAMVSSFVKGKGDAMAYNVCTDDGKKSMMGNWMTASGEHGIPCAFVIDQNGKIADIVLGYGGPSDHRLEDSIDQLLAGNFDYKASADRHNAELAKLQH